MAATRGIVREAIQFSVASITPTSPLKRWGYDPVARSQRAQWQVRTLCP